MWLVAIILYSTITKTGFILTRYTEQNHLPVGNIHRLNSLQPSRPNYLNENKSELHYMPTNVLWNIV